MQHLNDRATAIFRKLTENMRKVGDHQQWNNDSSFMAACVEIISRTGLGPLVSVCHYFEQNGDLMRDPDVVSFRRFVLRYRRARRPFSPSLPRT